MLCVLAWPSVVGRSVGRSGALYIIMRRLCKAQSKEEEKEKKKKKRPQATPRSQPVVDHHHGRGAQQQCPIDDAHYATCWFIILLSFSLSPFFFCCGEGFLCPAEANETNFKTLLGGRVALSDD